MVSAFEPDVPSARPAIHLIKGRSARLRRGHPWIYSNEIVMEGDARSLSPGTLVTVVDAGGEQLGVATFNPHALIAARLLSRNAATSIDAGFIGARIADALALRAALYEDPYYRLVHAEADGLPGVAIDRYGDVVVCQINSAGAEAMVDRLRDALAETLAPRGLVFRRDGRGRTLEGLESEPAIVEGAVATPLTVVEDGVSMFADVVAGQKTGWFFDQRDNRRFVATLARGRDLLDVYCHTGGFALLAAAAGARAVVGVERSAAAVALAEAAARRLGPAAPCRFERADGFSALEALAQETQRFDVVVADPPAFAKSRKEAKQALRGYRKLARLAARLVAPRGFLALASCSHSIAPEAFREAAARGIRDDGRQGRIIREASAGPDHPVHAMLPESGYLKFVVIALGDIV